MPSGDAAAIRTADHLSERTKAVAQLCVTGEASAEAKRMMMPYQSALRHAFLDVGRELSLGNARRLIPTLDHAEIQIFVFLHACIVG